MTHEETMLIDYDNFIRRVSWGLYHRMSKRFSYIDYDDVYQEARLAFLLHVIRNRPSCCDDAYLARILQRVVFRSIIRSGISSTKMTIRESYNISQNPHKDFVYVSMDDGHENEVSYNIDETEMIVNDFMKKLRPKERLVLMYLMRNMSKTQVAHKLRSPVSTVCSDVLRIQSKYNKFKRKNEVA